jgi:phospholipase/carboxylesterase
MAGTLSAWPAAARRTGAGMKVFRLLCSGKTISAGSGLSDASGVSPAAAATRALPGQRDFLLVLCHGIGGDARQLAPLAAVLNRAAPHAVPFLPEAPYRRRRWLVPQEGRQWFALTKPRERQFAPCRMAARALNARVDAELARRGFSPSQLVLAGFSQGAMVALLAGLNRPVAPRGIIAMAGALMAAEGHFVPACRPPVLLVHGDEDPVVPCARSEDAERRLRGAGLYVHLAILPGRDHLITAHAAPVAADFLAEIGA